MLLITRVFILQLDVSCCCENGPSFTQTLNQSHYQATSGLKQSFSSNYQNWKICGKSSSKYSGVSPDWWNRNGLPFLPLFYFVFDAEDSWHRLRWKMYLHCSFRSFILISEIQILPSCGSSLVQFSREQKKWLLTLSEPDQTFFSLCPETNWRQDISLDHITA